MAVPLVYIPCKRQFSKHALLMEQARTRVETEHVIDITRNNEASSSSSSSPSSVRDRISDDSDLLQHGDRPSSSARASISQLPTALSSNVLNSRTSSFGRRGNNHTRRRRSPLNSGWWISIELALTLAQIVASVVVLSLSRHEHPHSSLFAWIVGYACGCVATLPLLCWRYFHRNQVSDQESSQSRQNSSGSSHSIGRTFSRYATQTFEVDDRAAASSGSTGGQSVGIQSARLKATIEYAKMALDLFFAVWFVIGNVWVFGGHTSSSDAPNMYRLCVVFLAFSCVGYAMPFILCATICCCLPCIISVLGFREDLNQTRGATAESINALPTYKFKLKKSKNSGGTGGNEGGAVAVGTEMEQVIAGEDATCCICLANYVNNDELRELPCSHLFHKECVDKWLKINANCPLCKSEVGESVLSSLVSATAGLRRESRVSSGLGSNGS